jgi:hypothetical protein
MTLEKRFLCHCPSCGKEKHSRKRDVGKLCASCNMKVIEKKFRNLKFKFNKLTAQEHQKKTREKYKDDLAYRLKKLLGQAKTRAKKQEIECSLTLEELLLMFPADYCCPVFKTKMFWGCSGKGERSASPSLDRVNPRGGYTKDNVMIISWRANKIKSDCSAQELEAVLTYMKT